MNRRLQTVVRLIHGNKQTRIVAEIDDVLSVSPEIETQISVEIFDWQGTPLRTVNRASLIRLKMLRGNSQDLADVEKLR